MANILDDELQQLRKEKLEQINQQQRLQKSLAASKNQQTAELRRQYKLVEETESTQTVTGRPETEVPETEPAEEQPLEPELTQNKPQTEDQNQEEPQQQKPEEEDEDDDEEEEEDKKEDEDKKDNKKNDDDEPEEENETEEPNGDGKKENEPEEKGGSGQEDGGGLEQGLKNEAKDQVKKAAKKAIWEFLASTSWFWGPALAILSILGLLVGLFFFVTITAVAYCNQGGLSGLAANTVSNMSWLAGQGDFCEALQISQAPSSGGAGGGASFDPVPAPTPSPGGDPNGVGCQDCVTVASVGVPIKSANACATGFGPCQIESVVAQKLVALNSNLSGWQVTEAWPPTGYSSTDPNGIHQNSCHGNATCVDANFTNPSQATPQNISNFITESNAAGLRAVYEVRTQGQANDLIAQGVPSSNIQVVTAITASHFSVYNR